VPPGSPNRICDLGPESCSSFIVALETVVFDLGQERFVTHAQSFSARVLLPSCAASASAILRRSTICTPDRLLRSAFPTRQSLTTELRLSLRSSQGREFESRTIRQDARALDRVLEFAHVARPAACVQRCDTRVAERRFPAPHFLAELRGKMVREQNHVFAAITQWWNLDWKKQRAERKDRRETRLCPRGAQVFVVAATTRTSTGTGARPPMRSTHLSSMTRRSLP